jgi:hypothetical protein
MKKYRVKELSKTAYELFRSHSSEDKAFQFAAYVAYDEISRQESIESYALACVASEALAEHTTEGHRYAARLTLKNIALKKSMDNKRHVQMPWEQQSQDLLRLDRQDDPFFTALTRIADEGLESHGLAQEFKEKYPNHEEVESIKESYARAFSAAYLAYIRASSSKYITYSKASFERSIEEDLTFNLIDTESYSAICAYILMSTEMNIGMAAYAMLGVIVLALPTLGVTAVAPVACYAIGGIMSISGFSFCFWQASSVAQEVKETKRFETINTSDETHEVCHDV